MAITVSMSLLMNLWVPYLFEIKNESSFIQFNPTKLVNKIKRLKSYLCHIIVCVCVCVCVCMPEKINSCLDNSNNFPVKQINK